MLALFKLCLAIVQALKIWLAAAIDYLGLTTEEKSNYNKLKWRKKEKKN